MRISRRFMLAGAAVAALPAPALACVETGPELPEQGASRDLADRLAKVEQTAKEMRELLQQVAEIEAAAPLKDPASYAAWNAGEMDRISSEIDANAGALRKAVAAFVAAVRPAAG